MADRAYGPGEITALGEAIYREQIQPQVEPVEKGKFVVIDVETGDYEIDVGDAAATRRLLKRRPAAITYECASAIAPRTAMSVVFGCLRAMIRGKVNENQKALINGGRHGWRRPPQVLGSHPGHWIYGLSDAAPESIRQLGLLSVGQRTFELANGDLLSLRHTLPQCLGTDA